MKTYNFIVITNDDKWLKYNGITGTDIDDAFINVRHAAYDDGYMVKSVKRVVNL